MRPWPHAHPGFVTLASLIVMFVFVSAPEVSAESGGWTTMAPAPSKRTEVAAAVLNGKIYVVGGFNEPSLSNIAKLAVSNAVEVYDPQSDAWTAAAPLPVRLHHTATAVIGDRLYVIGGFTTGFLSLWNPVNSAYRYDPAANTWEDLPPMPTVRGALGVATIGGKLYAVGGIGGQGNSDAVEVYDPLTDTWSRKAPLPTPRDHLALAAAGDHLYAIGGRVNGSYANNLAVVEVYDPHGDAWQPAASLPTARSGIAAGVIGDTIYVVGGEAPEGTFNTNEAYSVSADRWQTAPPLPTARHGLGAAVIDDRLYVIAGGPTPGGSFSNVNERFVPGPIRTAASPPGRASPQHVGTVMALLATFNDAGVLPPESSPDAQRLIRALIQFQSAFMRSPNPAVTGLLYDALAQKLGGQTESAVRTFQAHGWTSRSLEAVVDYAARTPVWSRPALVEALRDYNVGEPEFAILATVFSEARAVLASEGRDVHAVYARWRGEMPGGSL